MRDGKCLKIRRLMRIQKPQLACRSRGLHAICTIPKLAMFYNSLFFKDLIVRTELAQCLQYPC